MFHFFLCINDLLSKNARKNEAVNQNLHEKQVSNADNKKKVLSVIRNPNADNEKNSVCNPELKCR